MTLRHLTLSGRLGRTRSEGSSSQPGRVEPNGLNINFEVGSTVSQAAQDVGLCSSNDLPAIEDCDMAGGL